MTKTWIQRKRETMGEKGNRSAVIKWKSVFFLSFVGGLVGFALWRVLGPHPSPTREELASAIRATGVNLVVQPRGTLQFLPKQIGLKIKNVEQTAQVQYSMNSEFQSEIEKLFYQYAPEYGAVAALDAKSGKVLALIGYFGPGKGPMKEHLALRASFPSASVFKVVTAAAAIAERKFSSQSPLVVTGRDHTLYRSQIFGRKNSEAQAPNRFSRFVTLKEAFGRSINSAFGKLGVFNLGPGIVRDYAERFGFNRAIASDLPVETGKAEISEEPFQLAEATSGFTLKNTMSPLQGALIAASIINDGILVEPYAVEKIYSDSEEVLYDFGEANEDTGKAPTGRSRRVLPKSSIPEMRELMAQTVTKGTSRHSFRGFHRSKYALVNVGGKTGSLTGHEPYGKYDWFVGYGAYKGKKIALSVLTVHGNFWTVKSAFIARKAIEKYFEKELN